MRFNAIRFIAGVAKRYQLDLCDEIGLMVYEESYAGWCLADSPKMPERYDESVLGMVRRDRNHPSVTMWGLLNETPDGPVFRHAVGVLPALRALDDSRLVMLNSGRWDAQSGGVAGIEVWRNAGARPIRASPSTAPTTRSRPWASPGRRASWPFHPGRDGEYAVVRWTAPADEHGGVRGRVHEHRRAGHHRRPRAAQRQAAVRRRDQRRAAAGTEPKFQAAVAVQAGDTLDCVCGYGNGNYGADTTALAVTVKCAGGKKYDAAADFSSQQNPNGPWSYGQFAPGDEARGRRRFAPFPAGQRRDADRHAEQPRLDGLGGRAGRQASLPARAAHGRRHPHAADDRRRRPAAVPLGVRDRQRRSTCCGVVRHYEQARQAEVEDAQFYRTQRDRFLADWERWRLAEAFDRPEDFFAQSQCADGRPAAAGPQRHPLESARRSATA